MSGQVLPRIFAVRPMLSLILISGIGDVPCNLL